MILGIDEVGRGPWAGPLVMGAVVLSNTPIKGLTDSKKLSKAKREMLDVEIRQKAAAIGLGWVSARELDEVGLSKALKLATRRAVEKVTVPYHEIIIDGTVNFLADTTKGQYVTVLKKADLLIASVSAASIVAKVARDAYMTEQAELYPEYAFAANVGYGTAAHRQAIETYGVTPEHRLSFAPLAKYRTNSKPYFIANKKSPTTKDTGDMAEQIAADYLRKDGHDILARNWKTKVCEIDIVSRRGDTVYLIEVKHRKNAAQGGGVAAITPRKLHQMTFAARVYVKAEGLMNIDLRLAVLTTTGESPEVEQFLELD